MATKKTSKDDAKTQVEELEKTIRELRAQVDQLTKMPLVIGTKSKRIVIESDKIESTLINFFRNERIFAGFRNTPARILITVASLAVLFGYGYYAFLNPELSGWYLTFLLLTLLANAISVRFVFQMDGDTSRHVLDEYHLKRRNKAKERAHDSLKTFIGLALVGGMFYGWKDWILAGEENRSGIVPDAIFNFSLTGGQLLVVLFFVIGYVSLTKYLGYGVKGEPFVSNDEDKKIRES